MKRATAWMTGVALLLGSATGAGAFQAHYLRAQAANQSNVESTIDPDDFHVDAPLVQIGVPGVDPMTYSASASADSASGLLRAQNAIQWSPETTPTPGLINSVSNASIEQALDWQDGGGPITVHIVLDWESDTSNDSGGQAIVTADLKVDSLCIVSATIRAGPAADDFVTCETDFPFIEFQSSSGGSQLSITGTWAAGHVGDGITVQVSVGSSLVTGGGSSFVSGLASGSLSIEVEGAASHAFTSPSFLTVPEPEGGEAGVAGMIALLVAGRSQWKTPRSVRRRN